MKYNNNNNFSELRCSTLPPLNGASGMFSTIKFNHTVIDTRKYRIALVVACMRGQLWLTFETIDDATHRSSTAAPARVGGSKHSGGDGGDDVLYVKTTTTSSL